MALSEDLSFSPESFSGKVRLFPLPNLVVFPHVMQPLHIFEPRYRAMLEEALAGDGLIGMVLLPRAGNRTTKAGRRCVPSVACAAWRRIIARAKDRTTCWCSGCGGSRSSVSCRPRKRFAKPKWNCAKTSIPTTMRWLARNCNSACWNAFKRILPKMPKAQEQLDQLLGGQIPLGMLTDIVAYTLDIELDFKERMLEETCVDRLRRAIVGVS